MKCIIIGDIGWHHLYHLGDEAMTEVAINQLRLNGINSITLIAGDPSAATNIYNLPAIRRPYFSSKWSRDQLEKQLTILSNIDDNELVKTIKETDAIIIAGGGNLNSDHVSHLYQRVLISRLARRFKKPVFVTSQTLGPMLKERDEQLLAELIETSTCFGLRETTSYEIAKRISKNELCNISRTLDDAVLIEPDASDYAKIDSLSLPERYIVGSFTFHSGATGWSHHFYQKILKNILDRIATLLDINILLAPHVGSLGDGRPNRDQVLNYELAANAKTGKIKALPMLTATQFAALLKNADLLISTRYHSLVFGPIFHTPVLGISTSYYSSIRMSGALENIGIKDHVIPIHLDSHIPSVCQTIINRKNEYVFYFKEIVKNKLEYQNLWWNHIISSINGKPWDFDTTLNGDRVEFNSQIDDELKITIRKFSEISNALYKSKKTNKWLKEDISRLEEVREKSDSIQISQLQARIEQLETIISQKYNGPSDWIKRNGIQGIYRGIARRLKK